MIHSGLIPSWVWPSAYLVYLSCQVKLKLKSKYLSWKNPFTSSCVWLVIFLILFVSVLLLPLYVLLSLAATWQSLIQFKSCIIYNKRGVLAGVWTAFLQRLSIWEPIPGIWGLPSRNLSTQKMGEPPGKGIMLEDWRTDNTGRDGDWYSTCRLSLRLASDSLIKVDLGPQRSLWQKEVSGSSNRSTWWQMDRGCCTLPWPQPCRCHGDQRKVDETAKWEGRHVESTSKQKEGDGSPVEEQEPPK